MTDNEIIKSFEHCVYSERGYKCRKCEYVTGCKSFLMREALALINRQKAVIERLEKNLDEKNEELDRVYDDLADSVETTAVIKAEAVKKFAKRLKKKETTAISCKRFEGVISTDDLDNLVKEFTEGG